jgi:acyl carrier protein
MIIELQDAFDMSFVQDDLKGVRTVGELTQLIKSRAKS